jgi:lipase maturation factor 1
MSCFFHRFLGGIFLAAYLSLYFQYDALYGPNGIHPLNQHLQVLMEHHFPVSATSASTSSPSQPPPLSLAVLYEKFHHLPSLLIFAPEVGISPHILGEFFLLCGLSSNLLICFGSNHPLLFLVNWICYTSLVLVDQTSFLFFHWDRLLVEVSFLAFAGSLVMVESKLVNALNWCYRFLIWKVLFVSAIKKLQSKAPLWSQFTAYEVSRLCLQCTLLVPSLLTFFFSSSTISRHKVCRPSLGGTSTSSIHCSYAMVPDILSFSTLR